MAWDSELRVLEEAIRRLSVEYDAFLYGSAKKPPSESHRRVEKMIGKLSGSEPEAAADRYRLATLQGRFATLCERWERLQAEKESGRRPGLYGHFSETGGRVSGGAPREFAGVPRANLDSRTAGSVQKESGVGGDADRVLYERYLEEKRRRGENVGGYDFKGFLEGLKRQRERLKERYGNREIEFEVAARDGKVKLVAKPRDKKS
ncbi:MAG: MXAN_5187 C-terminal domain-containing protein [Thermoanaerobaculia bacterium]